MPSSSSQRQARFIRGIESIETSSERPNLLPNAYGECCVVWSMWMAYVELDFSLQRAVVNHRAFTLTFHSRLPAQLHKRSQLLLSTFYINFN
jgi:hypothetical protein